MTKKMAKPALSLSVISQLSLVIGHQSLVISR